MKSWNEAGKFGSSGVGVRGVGSSVAFNDLGILMQHQTIKYPFSMSPRETADNLQADYPWLECPAIISAPMARVAKPPLAVAVSRAGGLGFIAAGYTSENLDATLEEASKLLGIETPSTDTDSKRSAMPVGVGFITWSASLETALPALGKYRPCAVWLFGPARGFEDLIPWATRIREVTSQQTKIWVQVGSVADAVQAAKAVQPDVLVVQGSDAGGHGLARGASIVSLVPEIKDRLRDIRASLPRPIQLVAAGGISDGRGVAAAVVLGAQGCALGTRFLACPEAMVPKGYQEEVIRASDGGNTTVRTRIYDRVRRVDGWPGQYNGRGLINRTYTDSQDGIGEDDNMRLYDEALQRGDESYGLDGRLTTYAGTGVGLVKTAMLAKDIVASIRAEAQILLYRADPNPKL